VQVLDIDLGLTVIHVQRRAGVSDRSRWSRDEQANRAARLHLAAVRRLLRDDEPLDPRLISLDALKRRAQPQSANSGDSLTGAQPFILLHAHATTTQVCGRVERLGSGGIGLGHTPTDREPAKPANEFSEGRSQAL
jgi:hypothetical protein